MKERGFDPLRLDVQAFARAGGALAGDWPQQRMPRLATGLGTPLADAAPEPVRWSARGERRERPGAEPEVWLHVSASMPAWLTCQRCLAPLCQTLAVDRSFRFVAGEAEAERLDEESDEDVLALTRSLDLAALVEDELILALPIVPRHDRCPAPLVAPDEVAFDVAPAPGPFSALEALRAPKDKR